MVAFEAGRVEVPDVPTNGVTGGVCEERERQTGGQDQGFRWGEEGEGSTWRDAHLPFFLSSLSLMCF